MKHLKLGISACLITGLLFLTGCSKNGPQTSSSTPPPKANFSYTTPNAGLLPAVANFTSTSTNATSYFWDFGDGNTSTLANPSNTYAVANTYNVKLVVKGAGGADSITKQVVITQSKPQAAFSFVLTDSGSYPTHVTFTNASVGASSYKWTFGNGDTSSAQNPVDSFFTAKTYTVKLVATNAVGSDSATKTVTINFIPPTASFSYTATVYQLPLVVTTTNTSQHATSYTWNFGDGSAAVTGATPTHSYTQGGIYTITLTATNGGGSAQATQTVRVSPYLITYTDFNGATLNLYAWEGKTIMLLMRTQGLDPTTMFNWAKVMDSAYSYYNVITGQFPSLYTGVTYINNHVTIADVPATCGAGCGYLGTTGIEMQNTYTDRMYSYAQNNQYDQELFYECGRNFWFYGNQLAYQTNDPIVTGYAVFMRFMSMAATGVNPAPFNSTPWTTFYNAEVALVDTFTNNPSYTWANTLGNNTGVNNSLGLGATDLFASFCMRLTQNYGGNAFVAKLWKYAGTEPAATTTQDAVDNFFLACCYAANKNLTTLFTVTWRWTISTAAQTKAAAYPN